MESHGYDRQEVGFIVSRCKSTQGILVTEFETKIGRPYTHLVFACFSSFVFYPSLSEQ